MRGFLIGIILGLIFGSCPTQAYEITGRMDDASTATVIFEATIVKRFAFATDITADLQKFVIEAAAKEALAEVKSEELRMDKYTLGYPLKEALNRQFEFYGYKATDVKIISVKTERTCNGKVCRP